MQTANLLFVEVIHFGLQNQERLMRCINDPSTNIVHPALLTAIDTFPLSTCQIYQYTLVGIKDKRLLSLYASYVWYSMEKLAGDLLLGSKANFSFQFIASYVWYSIENLAGDLLLGSKTNFSLRSCMTVLPVKSVVN